MSEKTKIQWTDNSWNPWHGCKKVSEGCKFCYMYRDKSRWNEDPTVVKRSKSTFNDPLKWKDPKMVFTCSWSDFFIEEADAWRDEAWEIIRNTPQHTYQILTKRPERIDKCLPNDWGDLGYDNVWLGVSIENQDALSRLWKLCLPQRPAFIKFISIEPLLEEISLKTPGVHTLMDYLIDWVIIGGESGNNTGKYLYRECNLEWIIKIINECKELDVPVFMKQTGTHIAKLMKYKDRHGGDMSEWPTEIQIREFPR